VRGDYQTYVTFRDPATGNKIVLSCLDAFIYYIYAYYLTLGKGPLAYIPQVFKKRVVKKPGVTLESIVQNNELSYVKSPVIAQLAQTVVSLKRTITNESFYLQCRTIFENAQVQRALISGQEHYIGVTQFTLAVEYLYESAEVDLIATPTLYSDWISSKNLPDISGYSNTQLVDLYSDILKNATGVSLNQVLTFKSIQDAMVGILSSLTSYSIQISAEVNADPIIVNDSASQRATMADETGVDLLRVFSSKPDMVNTSSNQASDEPVDASTHDVTITTEHISGLHSVIVSAEHEMLGDITFTINPIVATPTVAVSDSVDISANTPWILGSSSFDALSDSQKHQLKDIFCQCFPAMQYNYPGFVNLVHVNWSSTYQYWEPSQSVSASFAYYPAGGSMPDIKTENLYAKLPPVVRQTVVDLNALSYTGGVAAIDVFTITKS
jgi:hypothetical protein